MVIVVGTGVVMAAGVGTVVVEAAGRSLPVHPARPAAITMILRIRMIVELFIRFFLLWFV
jgi:hypothetical protein